jgi:hypothetical protein
VVDFTWRLQLHFVLIQTKTLQDQADTPHTKIKASCKLATVGPCISVAYLCLVCIVTYCVGIKAGVMRRAPHHNCNLQRRQHPNNVAFAKTKRNTRGGAIYATSHAACPKFVTNSE